MANNEQVSKVKVWDPVVRVFHWSLVLLFIIAYITGEDENNIHIYAGYAVLALVLFRVLWGLIGTKHARFSDFVYSPATVMRYAKSVFSGQPEYYVGHNPLGGWMIVLLLITLLGISWSGLEVYGAEGHGPLAGQNSILVDSAYANGDEDEHENETGKGNEEAEEFWEEIHESLTNFALLLIALHITGVIVGSVKEKENLVKAMINGHKSLRQ